MYLFQAIGDFKTVKNVQKTVEKTEIDFFFVHNFSENSMNYFPHLTQNLKSSRLWLTPNVYYGKLGRDTGLKYAGQSCPHCKIPGEGRIFKGPIFVLPVVLVSSALFTFIYGPIDKNSKKLTQIERNQSWER